MLPFPCLAACLAALAARRSLRLYKTAEMIPIATDWRPLSRPLRFTLAGAQAGVDGPSLQLRSCK